MSAILRLTEEALVIDKGRLAMRAPTAQAVDFYLSHGFSQEGKRDWLPDDIPADAHPFRPLAVRVLNTQGKIADTVRSVEPVTIEVEYQVKADITGLRVGIYVMSTRGEYIFTSFDTDQPEVFESCSVRKIGQYISRCTIPADFLNEGRFVIGVNASSFRVKRYFQDEQALSFNVDAAGAPGTHWPEPRMGAVRPRLQWDIEVMKV
jgi:lipopolysaccharide transport system ATP-binding protein